MTNPQLLQGSLERELGIDRRCSFGTVTIDTQWALKCAEDRMSRH
jgi:hypothetical protein